MTGRLRQTTRNKLLPLSMVQYNVRPFLSLKEPYTRPKVLTDFEKARFLTTDFVIF